MDTTRSLPTTSRPSPLPGGADRGVLWAVALAVVVLAIATVVAFAPATANDGVQRIGGDPNAPVDGLSGDTDVSGPGRCPSADYLTFDGEHGPARDRRATAGRELLGVVLRSVRRRDARPSSGATGANQDAVDFLGLQVGEAAESGRDMIARTADHLSRGP